MRVLLCAVVLAVLTGCQHVPQMPPLLAVDYVYGFDTEIASGQPGAGDNHGNASHAEGYRRVSRHRPSLGAVFEWAKVKAEATLGVWLYEHGEGQATTLRFRLTREGWRAKEAKQ